MTKRSNIITKNSCFPIFGKRKVIIWSILLFSFWFILVAGDKKTVKASSAMISITTQNPKVQVGDEVYVIITIRSADSIQGVEGYFTYDNRYLRYEKGGGFVHGNDDAFRILDVERGIGATKVKYSVKFTARKEGSSTIQLKKPYAVIAADDTGSKMSVSYTPLNLLVEEKTQVESPKEKSQTENSEKKQQKEESKEKPQAKTTEKNSKEKSQTASNSKKSKSGKKETDTSGEEEGKTEKDEDSMEDAEEGSVQETNDAELQELENAKRKVKSYQYMLGIMATFCGLMVLLVIAFWMRSKKY